MMIVGDKITKVDAQRGKLEAGIKIETKPEITKVTTEELFAAGEKRTGALVEFKVKPVPSVCVNVVSPSAPNLRTDESDPKDKLSAIVTVS